MPSAKEVLIPNIDETALIVGFEDHVHGSSLGNEAVKHAMLQAEKAVNGVTNSAIYDQRQVEYGVKQARRDIHKVKADERANIPTFLSSEEMPSWLRHATDTDEDPKSLTAKLADPDKIPDATALNVLEWRNWRQVKRNQEFEAEGLPKLKEHYIEEVKRAIEAGWMPKDVLERASRLDQVKVLIDDGFTTDLRGVLGSASHNSERIKLSPIDDNQQHTYDHEANHLMCGSDDGEYNTVLGMLDRSKHGLNRVFRSKTKIINVSPDNGAAALDEAVTEHIALSLEHGDIDRILLLNEDGMFDNDSGSYPLERLLLDTLCNYGVVPVDIRLFVNAYFEATEEQQRLGGNSAAAILVSKLQEAFPRIDVMPKLVRYRNKDNGKAIEKLIKNLEKEGSKGPIPEGRWMPKVRSLGSY